MQRIWAKMLPKSLKNIGGILPPSSRQTVRQSVQSDRFNMAGTL